MRTYRQVLGWLFQNLQGRYGIPTQRGSLCRELRSQQLRISIQWNIIQLKTAYDNGGCAGFSDGEIYSQAVHYFDEDNIDVGKPLNCHIAVNHVVQLTDEEKAEAHRQAIEQYQCEQLAKMCNHSERTKKAENKIVQPSLFD